MLGLEAANRGDARHQPDSARPLEHREDLVLLVAMRLAQQRHELVGELQALQAIDRRQRVGHRLHPVADLQLAVMRLRDVAAWHVTFCTAGAGSGDRASFGRTAIGRTRLCTVVHRNLRRIDDVRRRLIARTAGHLDMDQGGRCPAERLMLAKTARDAVPKEGAAAPSGISQMKYGTEIVVVGLAAFLAMLGAAFAADDLFRAHMWVLTAVLAAGTVVLLRRTSFGEARVAVDQSQYMDEPIRYGSIATVFWAVIGLLVGVVIALQLAYPDLN